MSEAQAGFRKGYSTTDQIYLLSNVLLNYFYVKSEDCSAHLSIIVKHSTRSTGQPYGKN